MLAVVGGVAAAVVSSGVSQTPRGSGDDGSYQWVLSFAKQYGQYFSGLAGGQVLCAPHAFSESVSKNSQDTSSLSLSLSL